MQACTGEKLDLLKWIFRFGAILNREGLPLEIGLRSVFLNSVVDKRREPASGEGSALDLTPLDQGRGSWLGNSGQ